MTNLRLCSAPSEITSEPAELSPCGLCKIMRASNQFKSGPRRVVFSFPSRPVTY